MPHQKVHAQSSRNVIKPMFMLVASTNQETGYTPMVNNVASSIVPYTGLQDGRPTLAAWRWYG
jgi:hypothetical protein